MVDVPKDVAALAFVLLDKKLDARLLRGVAGFIVKYLPIALGNKLVDAQVANLEILNRRFVGPLEAVIIGLQ